MISNRSIGLRIFVGGAIALAVGFLSRIRELRGLEFVGMTHGSFRLGNPATAAGLGLQLITYEAQFEKN